MNELLKNFARPDPMFGFDSDDYKAYQARKSNGKTASVAPEHQDGNQERLDIPDVANGKELRQSGIPPKEGP